MQSKRTRSLYMFFGISMAVLMAVTLFLPGLAPDPAPVVQDVPTPTPRPIPTFPPPLTDFSGITFDVDYLHSSGLYAIDVPAGWTVTNDINNGTQVQTALNNPSAVSVIEVYLEQPATMPTTLQELDARFTSSTLAAGWRQYTGGWEELARRTENERVVIDFSLRSGEGQQFLARHAAWFDDHYIYVVRVVAPQNARDLLFHMLGQMVERVTVFPQFTDTPLAWNAHFDASSGFIVRLPQEWRLTDGGQGLPTSFLAPDGAALRLETLSDTIADEDGAREWVQGLRSALEITSVETVSRVGGEGFAVAYTFRTPDGDPFSGLALLLTDETGATHAADIRLPGSVDLNSEDGQEAQPEAAAIMATFSMMTGLDLPQPEAEDAGD